MTTHQPGSKSKIYKLSVYQNLKIMPWYNGNYPPSYKNQPVNLREKAVEIANALLEDGADEGVAIATGLKQARLFFKDKEKRDSDKESL